MSLLGSILGGLAGGRRSYGTGGWNRGRTSYGRRPMGYGYGRSRVASGGILGGSLGRMAIGGLTAYGMRRFFGNRSPYSY
ncbi:hypothetical protein HPC49_44140 [Pyxidicoccus fallax]|uniref:Uncharacterized protein n=1 Tax=Pyxidicoccus fallax TaxID=394095 RepID=A0A848LGB4_9BACT|nr:hypothetical protein [Pyxidicoccus fallax]NMO15591.1 hypothetical protein [Pyxidicoccus fallax]NPC85174.1 hypothetical protein [Pyxidicoccus fallax]